MLAQGATDRSWRATRGLLLGTLLVLYPTPAGEAQAMIRYLCPRKEATWGETHKFDASFIPHNHLVYKIN
ncbi:hypothetical protein [Porphyromonas sp. COT-290 OH3588]|uniref:hypothetical protein n=1 Tax=Porphyromonas sp. COT-290 OH3588 TaxID=1515617 RepID=UPI00136368DD|nr:hypothetical protein [Porphyromonas sp. COT-290 OH3588]